MRSAAPPASSFIGMTTLKAGAPGPDDFLNAKTGAGAPRSVDGRDMKFLRRTGCQVAENGAD
jgi:hypothetical protein